MIMHNTLRHFICLLAVGSLFALVQVQAFAQTKEEAGEAAQDDGLVAGQNQLATRFKKLEGVLLRSAEIEETTNPARAKLMQQAAALAKQVQLSDALVRAARSLEQKQYSQAIEDQKASLENLNKILELLQSENRTERVRQQKDQVRRTIEETQRLLRLQSSLRGRTEGGSQTEKAASDQQKLAEKAAQIAQELNPDAKDQNAKDADKSSEKEGSQNKDSQNKDGQNKDGQSKDGQPKDGQSKDGQDKDSQSKQDTDKKDTDKKDTDKKDPEKKPANDGKGDNNKDDKNKDAKGENGNGDKSKDDKSKDGQSKDDKGQESKDGDKSSESKDGQPSESQSGDPKSAKPQENQQPGKQSEQSQPSDGQSQESSEQQQQQQQPKNPIDRATQRLKQAQKKMQEAQKNLEDAQREGAVEKQRQAEQELKTAIEDLEEILRQLREEEIERSLTALEERLRLMLQLQNKVLDETKRLQEIGAGGTDRQIEIRANSLAADEKKILNEAQRALLLLREEGTSAAFPESLSHIISDMQNVHDRLTKADIGKLTVSIEADIVESLEELLAAMSEVKKENKERKQQQMQMPGQQQGQPGEQPLVNQLAEMRLIKTLQLRINRRTDTLSAALKDPNDVVGQAEADDIQTQLRELSERQSSIKQVTRDIVSGKNRQ